MTFELKLKDIELQNFRLFDKVNIAFDDKLTVLISENGAGKTALLEGIAKALTVVTERLAHDETNLNNKGIYLLEDIKNETAASTTVLHLLSKVSSNLATTIGWQLRFNRRSAVVQVEQAGTFLDAVTQQVDDTLSTKQPINLPVIVYYPCERLITSSKNGQEDNYGMDIFNAYDHALDGLSLNYKRFLDWYDWQERIERINKNNNVLDIVKEAILAILNDPEDASFKNIYIDPSQFKNLRLIIQKGEDKVEVNQLSSGEKSLLMLVSNLAYRLALLNPNAKNPLKEGQGIVLIDEIDLHLHPRWQREVVPKLLSIFPKIQWVVTTHSPFIIAAEHVTPENAYLITEDADTKKKVVVSVQDLGKQTEGLEPNRILKEIMNVSLRNKETETDIQKLSSLLTVDDFDKPETQTLYHHLLEQLGKQDSFIVRAAHRLSVLERQKPVTV